MHQEVTGRSDGPYCFGVRPVVTLKGNVFVTNISESTTHNEPETAWGLSLGMNN